MHTPSPPALFLRTDGTLMLARSDGTTIEIQLTPKQLVQIGFDCLQVAISLKPECLPEVLAALEKTTVQVPVSQPGEVPCLLN